MTNKLCKNCNNSVEYSYCAHCGQKTSVESLTLKRLVKEISDNIFQVNYGLFFSIKEFTLRPAHSINNYLNGKRRQYFQPIAYAFTLATLYFIIARLTGDVTVVEELFEGYLIGIQEKGDVVSESSSRLIKWVSDNYAYTTLMIVPMFSIASFIVFINNKRNILEHLVVNLYITGHQSIVYATSAMLSLISDFGDIRELITVFVSVLYATWTLTSFFNQNHVLIRLIQVLMTYLISLVLLSLVVGASLILVE
jgi:hypothetical protein